MDWRVRVANHTPSTDGQGQPSGSGQSSGVAQLDRSSPMPLWAQLLDDLRHRLRQGEFAERFPTDHELVETYGVSRQTAREAVRCLRQEGLVERLRGRGTRVTVPELEQPMGTHYSLFRDVETRGGVQTNVVRHLDVRTDAGAAAQLELAPDEPLVYLERLRLVEGEPLSVERSWLPAEITRPLLDADFTRTALDEELRHRCGLVAVWARERARAVVPGIEEREALGMGRCQPAFAIERISRVADGRCLQWRTSTMRGDRYVLAAEWRGSELASAGGEELWANR